MRLSPAELVQRTGSGTAVLCEGETHREDEFIFLTWFAGRAVTFFAYDGWYEVVRAVEAFRGLPVPVPVYGVRDRDVADEEVLAREASPLFVGPVFTLPRYSIENYLLEPEGWRDVVRRLFAREGAPPPDWQTVDAVRERIFECYSSCIVEATHNYVVAKLDRHRTEPGFTMRRYRGHSGSDEAECRRALCEWAANFGQEAEAQRLFDARLAQLRGVQDIVALSRVVSGKLVLRRLCQHVLPQVPGRGRADLTSLVDRYLESMGRPPEEVAALIERIERLGKKERAERTW